MPSAPGPLPPSFSDYLLIHREMNQARNCFFFWNAKFRHFQPKWGIFNSSYVNLIGIFLSILQTHSSFLFTYFFLNFFWTKPYKLTYFLAFYIPGICVNFFIPSFCQHRLMVCCSLSESYSPLLLRLIVRDICTFKLWASRKLLL